MQKYLDFYKATKVPHLQMHADEIMGNIAKGQSTIVTSLPFMGSNRLLDYINFLLDQKEYPHLYLNQPDPVVTQLSDYISSRSNDNKPTVLVIPHMHNLPKSVVEYINKLLVLDKGETLHIVAYLPPQFLEGEDFGLGQALAFIENLIVRKVYDEQATKEALEFRCEQLGLAQPQLPSREVWTLSGGVDAVIKQICKQAAQGTALTSESLVSNHVMTSLLANLDTQFNTLQRDTLRKLGIEIETLNTKFKLLNTYRSSKDPLAQFDLTPSMQQILKLFLSRKGELITLAEIDETLRGTTEYSFWGNYKAVSRLKRTVGSVYNIVNVKGKGYILKNASG